ncbi:unnamed protein product, partial [Symbiodinium pilosum]
MEGGKNVAGYLTALLDLLVDRQDAFVPGDFQAEERELYGLDCLFKALVRTLRLLDVSVDSWQVQPLKHTERSACVKPRTFPGFHALFATLAVFCPFRRLFVPSASPATSSSPGRLPAKSALRLCALPVLKGGDVDGPADGYGGAAERPVVWCKASTLQRVRLNEGDPPSEWKKIRRACLESVADIFDALLLMMHNESRDDLSTLHSHLSASMWEALMECLGDGSLEASALLDLCGNATLCSVLACHLFSVPLAPLAAGQLFAPHRVLRLQESFAHAYCRLYQPDALWGTGKTGEMADLQAELDSYVLNLAGAAVQLEVLGSFLQCCETHVAWARSGNASGSPTAVLLCRLVSTLALASMHGSGELVQRHMVMLTPAILTLADSFAELLIARLPEARTSASEPLLAAQAMLDAVVGLASLRAADCCRHSKDPDLAMVEALAGRFLECQDVHPALLARLALGLLASPVLREVLQCYQRLTDEEKAMFWQQVDTRSRLLFKPSSEVRHCLQDAGFEVKNGPSEAQPLLDLLMERYVEQLSSSSAGPADMAEDSPLEMTKRLLRLEEEATTEKSLEAESVRSPISPKPNGSLGAVSLPAFESPASPAPRRKAENLARGDIARLRGVDPLDAPEDLRCAIDGKLMAAPIRSPHGHFFERDTLLRWISSCGSICPITSKPLRAEDCEPALEMQQRVLDWVKAAQAAYKQKLK